MRKTKIICTLGPSTDKDGVLRELIANGMNVARFNFSHGSHEEHKGVWTCSSPCARSWVSPWLLCWTPKALRSA